jgi:hypothetical protein
MAGVPAIITPVLRLSLELAYKAVKLLCFIQDEVSSSINAATPVFMDVFVPDFYLRKSSLVARRSL